MSSTSQASGKRRTADDAGSGSAKSSSKSSAKASDQRKAADPLHVTLEHARWRHFGWLLFGLGLGTVLMVKLGAVGRMAGALLVLLAGYHGYRFLRTLLKPAGTIAVNQQKVELPLGLCHGEVESFATGEIDHVFMLRRAVPWTTTGPMLVIEVGDRAFTYPRDWFASESDQRRVARTIQLHQGRQSAS